MKDFTDILETPAMRKVSMGTGEQRVYWAPKEPRGSQEPAGSEALTG